MSFTTEQVNEVFPGSPGGVIEACKRGVIVALRRALTDTTLSDQDTRTPHVDLEYPLEKAQYPGIWVQFSLTSLRNSGLAMMVRDPETGDLLQQFSYGGRVTLTLVALTSMERDRLSDLVISLLAFSRVNESAVLTGNSQAMSALYTELEENPYLSMTVNADVPNPGGQSVSIGVPWDDALLAYEDTYSFEVIGEFQLVATTEGFYRLSRVDIVHQVDPDGWV